MTIDLGTKLRWVRLVSRPLYHLGNSLRYPLDRRMGGHTGDMDIIEKTETPQQSI
jgi:hypothetical protein